MVLLRMFGFDSCLPFRLDGLEMICLREPPAEGNDEKRRCCAKPEETFPAVGSRRDQCAVEGCGQEVTGRIPLLIQSREQASSFVGKILKCSSSCGSKEPCGTSVDLLRIESCQKIPYLPSRSRKANGQQETAIDCCRIPTRVQEPQRERG
mgnify:FL=1